MHRLIHRLATVLLVWLLPLSACSSTSRTVVRKVQVTEDGVKLPINPHESVVFALPRSVVVVELPIQSVEAKLSPFLQECVRDYLGGIPFTTAKMQPERHAKTLERIRSSVVQEFRNQGGEDCEPEVKTDSLLAAEELHAILDLLVTAGLGLSVPGAESFSLGAPVLSTRPEPDPLQVYMAEAKDAWLTDSGLTLELGEDGTIAGAKSTSENKVYEFSVDVLQAVGSIADVVALMPDYSGGEDPKPAIARAALTLSTIGKQRSRLMQLFLSETEVAVHIQADEAYLDKLTSELKSRIAQLSAYFSKQSTKAWSSRWEVRPPVAGGRTVLFRFDPKCGVQLVEGGSLVGLIPKGFESATGKHEVSLRVEPRPGLTGGDEYYDLLKLVASESGSQASWQDGELRRAYPYRVPRRAQVALYQVKEAGPILLKDAVLPIEQMGVALSLPSVQASQRSETSVAYHPGSGMLKTITLNNTSKDFGAGIKAVGDSTKAYLEGREGRELQDLENRKKKLELEKSIRDLEAELQGS